MKHAVGPGFSHDDRMKLVEKAVAIHHGATEVLRSRLFRVMKNGGSIYNSAD